MSEPTPPTETDVAVVDRMAAARAARAAKAAEAPVSVSPEVEASEDAAEAPAGPTTMEKAALTEDARRAAKVAALRAAKLSSASPVGEPEVLVRITKMGHGKVSMGEHISGLDDLTYDHGETPTLLLSIAKELEARGFVEIQ